MNRKKKEKSMLRKEGNVCVLDLLVKVPPIVVAPTQSIKETSHVPLQQLNFFDGRRSERGRHVQAN